MATQACPACGAANDVSIYVSGKRIRCHACGLHFIVERPESMIAPAAVAPRPVRVQAKPRVAGSVVAAVAEPKKASGDTRPGGTELTVPGFVIHEMLGKGGMGRVYRARQLSLDRWVAIKVLNEDLAKHHSFVRRFEKESGALAALNHPNITAIYDRGHHADLYFFVMEYVGGPSLRGKMQDGLSVEDSLSIFQTLCSAVGHAHQRSVIHRDLKPENVLFSEEGVLKVADFGLANIVAPDRRWELTRTRVSMGTVNYMAPEQRRDAKHVDHRADIYSLGVMLYEMLTGELPVGRFQPPSQLRRGVDTRVDRIVLRMLENDSDRRPQNATLVAVTVREILADGRPAAGSAPLQEKPAAAEPISSRSTEPPEAQQPPSPPERPATSSAARRRRHLGRLLKPAVAMVMLAVSVSLLLWWLFHRNLGERPGDLMVERSGDGYAVKVVHPKQITYLSPQKVNVQEGKEVVIYDFLSSSQMAGSVLLAGGVWWKERGRFVEDSCAKGFAVNQLPARAIFGDAAASPEGFSLLARFSAGPCLVTEESGERLSLESFVEERLGSLSLVVPLQIVRRVGLGFVDAVGNGVELSLPLDGEFEGRLARFGLAGAGEPLRFAMPPSPPQDEIEHVLELFFQQGRVRVRVDGVNVLDEPAGIPETFRGLPALLCQNSRCEFSRLEFEGPSVRGQETGK